MRRIALILFTLFLSFSLYAQVPASSHVVLVMEENHSYESVIGNRSMPYLNGLAQKYGLATQFYANTHPSIGNYFMLTTGQIITNNDSYGGTVTANNLVRQIAAARKSWKSYAENLPAVGYTGGDMYPYFKHHNPFAYFSDVLDNPSEKQNLVPFTRFSSDLANNRLPNFSFIVPNAINDAHNGSLAQADQWLQQHISPLVNNHAFQTDGLLIIAFDESNASDLRHGGGRIALLVIGPKVKRGFRSTHFYQHPSALRLIAESLRLPSRPGASANAPSMAEFFTSGSSFCGAGAPSPSVTICTPASDGATVNDPVHFVAAATSSTPVTAMQIYDNGNLIWQTAGNSIDTSVSLQPGAHTLAAKAWTSQGSSFLSLRKINVP